MAARFGGFPSRKMDCESQAGSRSCRASMDACGMYSSHRLARFSSARRTVTAAALPRMPMTASFALRPAAEDMRIETGRCVLRPLVAEDAASIARHANDHDVWVNLRDRFPHPYAEKDLLEY